MGGRNFAFVTKSLPNGGAWQDMFSISGVWMPVISELLAQGGVSGSITRNQAMSIMLLKQEELVVQLLTHLCIIK